MFRLMGAFISYSSTFFACSDIFARYSLCVLQKFKDERLQKYFFCWFRMKKRLFARTLFSNLLLLEILTVWWKKPGCVFPQLNVYSWFNFSMLGLVKNLFPLFQTYHHTLPYQKQKICSCLLSFSLLFLLCNCQLMGKVFPRGDKCVYLWESGKHTKLLIGCSWS